MIADRLIGVWFEGEEGAVDDRFRSSWTLEIGVSAPGVNPAPRRSLVVEFYRFI